MTANFEVVNGKLKVAFWYQADLAKTQAILEDVFAKAGCSRDELKAGRENIWLPTCCNVPLPSSDFIMEQSYFNLACYNDQAKSTQDTVHGVFG